MKPRELFEKGQQCFLEKKFKESRDFFGKALAEGYDPIRGHLSIGAAYLHEQQFDEAMHEFSQVIELDKENDRAHYYRGIAYMKKRDFPCAIADLNRSIKTNRKRPASYFARAIAEAEAGREEEAIEDFKRVAAASKVEVSEFTNLFGSTMTLFDRSMALLEGSPLNKGLNEAETARLRQWIGDRG